MFCQVRFVYKVRSGFAMFTDNVLQLPEVRVFETVFYRTATNKAKYLMDICKAKYPDSYRDIS